MSTVNKVDGASLSSRFYAGWIMVAVAFTLGFMTNVFYAYSRGIWLTPVATDLNADRFQVSLAFSLVSIVSALSGPWIGRLLDRLPVRRVLLVAAVWLALGYVFMSMVTSLLALYLVMGVFMGLAFVALADAGPAKLVVNWFSARRGMALSIVAMGASTAGVFTPPLIAALIETVGWRGQFLVFAGVLVLFIVPLVGFGIRNDPAEAGVEPEPAPFGIDDTDDERDWGRAEFLRTPDFWGIALVFGIMLGTFGGTSTHLFAHMSDIGVSPGAAATVLSAMALLALLAKPFFGWMIDRFDPRLAVAVSVLCQAAALGLLLFFKDYAVLLGAALLFGLGYGGMVPLRNAITALAFGRMSFGSISGALRPVQLPLVVASIPFAGWVFDTFGNYDLAFAIFCGLQVLSAAAILLLRQATNRSAKLRAGRAT